MIAERVGTEKNKSVRPPRAASRPANSDAWRSTGGAAAPAAPGTTPAAAVSRQPMARRGPKVVRRAQERPMLAAVLGASFCVSLAALYVSAYARVTAAGLEQAQLTRATRAAEVEEDNLRAEISRLTLATGVKARAEQMGMQPNTAQTTHLVGPVATATGVSVATAVHPLPIIP